MLTIIFSLFSLAFGQTAYCPAASDLTTAYGSASIYNRGWTITGGGAAATRSSFNLLGGSVEFDVDFRSTRTGVNANIYTISPSFSGSFSQGNYCDGQGSGGSWCPEIDWIETNGNCGGQSTIHTRSGGGNDGCTAWGCHSTFMYNGASAFHMKVSFDTAGVMTVVRNGVTINPGSYNPQVQAYDWSVLANWYRTKGAVIYSSQWVGWVPAPSCGTSGDLGSSRFSISNLKITGKVVSGPIPTLCSGFVPTTPRPTYPAVSPTTPRPPPSGTSSYCIDAPVQDGVSCAQHQAWGNCGKPWMVGQCRKTCGTCGPCSDIPVPGDPNTCAQQASWGNCLQPYMSGRCDISCGRCRAGAAREAEQPHQPTDSSSNAKTGIIIGAAVGGFVFIVAVVGLAIYFWHRSSVERV